MAKVALVTVLYNSEDVLEGFFKSLSRQTFKDYHLFLVDNKPSENTVRCLKELTSRYPIRGYTHIQNPKNLGVAKGNNQGIEHALADGYSHTILLNNDIEFEQESLIEEMVGHAVKHNESLVIPKIYFYDSGRIWMAGGKFRKARGIVGHIGEGEKDNPSNSVAAYFEYAPTCFMLINNEVFHRIGLMDEKFFVYYDDVDFLFRARKHNYKILLMPDLKVLHKVSSSTGGGESLFTIYYNTRNRIYFLRKNYRGVRLIIPMTFTLLSRLMRCFFYNKHQNKEIFRAFRDGFAL